MPVVKVRRDDGWHCSWCNASVAESVDLCPECGRQLFAPKELRARDRANAPGEETSALRAHGPTSDVQTDDGPRASEVTTQTPDRNKARNDLPAPASASGTSEAQERPRPVSTAVTLLYVNFALGILGNLVSLASGAVPGWSIISIAIGAIAQLWFINKIGQGKNWARFLYLVLFILGVPITIGGLFLMRGAMVAVSVAGMLIGFTLSIIILTRLFGTQSSPWFKRKPTS